MAADLGTAGEVRSTIAGEELHEGVSSDDYRADMSADINVFTVGVLEEGFVWHAADSGVEARVRSVIDLLETAGVTVQTVLGPAHRDSLQLFAAL